jgi:hypothetical protein
MVPGPARIIVTGPPASAFPLNAFDSGVTKSKVSAAKAALLAQEETHRQNLDSATLDVRQCYLNLRESEKRISTTQTAVAQAEEDYRIAQVRYQAALGTNTDVLDAQVALTTARNNFNQALYDYNMNKNALQTSMGIGARPIVAAPVVDKTTNTVLDKQAKEKYAKEKQLAKELKIAERDADKANIETQERLAKRNGYESLKDIKARLATQKAEAAKATTKK